MKNYLDIIYQRLPPWAVVKRTLLMSRWMGPAINLIVAVIMFFQAINQEAGYLRDFSFWVCGLSMGVFFLALMTPMRIMYLSAEQKKAISDDLALCMIQAAIRAEEVYGAPFKLDQELPPPNTKMN